MTLDEYEKLPTEERSAITNAIRDLPVKPSYAMALANESYTWYRKHAVNSRRAYKCLETALLIVAVAIPTSAAIAPHNVIVPAILGAVVVILSGLRSVFHWQDNYLRFSGAREAVEAERRLYETGAVPYADETSKDQILAAAVSRIEQRRWPAGLRSPQRGRNPDPAPTQPVHR